MLAITRKDGQWVEITHHSGDKLFVRVYDFGVDETGRPLVRLAFEDAPRNFAIDRPRHHEAPPAPPLRHRSRPGHVATPPHHPRSGGVPDVRPAS